MPLKHIRRAEALARADENGDCWNPLDVEVPSPHQGTVGNLLALLACGDSTLRGRQFETIVRFWLRADPVYAPQVARIWRWEDWPGADGPDRGIDLVVETVSGQLWAVQCKGYAATGSVTKAAIDSFLSASATSAFAQRLLVMSTDRLAPHAQRTMLKQAIPVVVVGLAQLEASPVRWPETLAGLHTADPAASLRCARRPLREHQLSAVDDVVAELEGQLSAGDDARASLIMACGSGKTLTCHGIAERIAARKTLVLVPSLALLAQTLREWSAQSAGQVQPIAVCSDDTVAAAAATDADISAAELAVPVLTDARALAARMQAAPENGRPLVVFSTYHSSPVVAEAQRILAAAGTPARFDLAVADEAHYLAGNCPPAFGTILDRGRITAARRVFATATPKVVQPRIAARARQLDLSVISMSDTAVFGPVAHRLSFADAIGLRLLADYQVLVLGVDPYSEAAAAVTNRHLVDAGGRTIDATTFAALVAAGRAFRERDVRTALSFHTTVARARCFAELLTELEAVAPSASPGPINAAYVSGGMPSSQRARLIRQFAATGTSGGPPRALLANARCLTAGVDLPDLDAVVFADPRRSTIEIVQAVGRALRRTATKERGLIVLPVVLRQNDDPDTVLASSAFDAVWQVIAALRDHDERLAEELDELRTALGRDGIIGGGSLGRLVVDLPVWSSSELAGQLRIRAVEVTSSGFYEGLGQLQAYVSVHGDARVRQSYVMAHGFNLGAWVTRVRAVHRAGRLASERASTLQVLPGWVWDSRDADYAAGLQALRHYMSAVGDARVPKDHVTDDGLALGQWVQVRRLDRKIGRLSRERQQQLEDLPGWSWNVRDSRYERGYNAIRAFVAEHGHARVPAGHVTATDFHLGRWVSKRRTGRKRNRLSAEQVAELEALPGWRWEVFDEGFDAGLDALRAYADEHGHTRVASAFKTEDGFKLGQWVTVRRQDRAKGKLPEDRAAELERLPGWSWHTRNDRFEHRMASLQEYVAEHGDARVPHDHVTADGFDLGKWITKQQSAYKADRLAPDRIAAFESLPGWSWGRHTANFDDGLRALRVYVEVHGDACVSQSYVTADHFRLGGWVAARRQEHRKGVLLTHRVAQLESLPGWRWTVPPSARSGSFEAGMAALLDYVAEHRHGHVPVKYRCADGFRLGAWVSRRRAEYKRGGLAPDRIQQLEAVPGWIWEGRPGVES
ncbi:Helicase associated domain protein [Plantactinospora sp. WMMB334]|uniref:DEAD/DEAH box helicase n=1 Tax=Plantactinospora sp. WMMB334 TaxID=3404119 RepID=UPI003B9378AE